MVTVIKQKQYNFSKILMKSFIIALLLFASLIILKTFLNTDKVLINVNTIKFEDNISMEDKQQILGAANLIPLKVSNVVAKKYSINVVSTPVEKILNEKYHYDVLSATGVTLNDQKVIYASCKYPSSFVHEVGHAYSHIYGLSDSTQWNNIYLSEKNNYQTTFADKYITKNSSEFFAEMFSRYCLEPKNLKVKSPVIYNYFKDLLKDA